MLQSHICQAEAESSEIPSQVLVRPWALAASCHLARYSPSNLYSGSSTVLVSLVQRCTGCCRQPEEHLLLAGTEGSDRRRSRGRGDGTEMPSVGPRQGRTGSWDWVSRVQVLGRSSWQGCGAAVCASPVEQGAAGGKALPNPSPAAGRAEGSQRTSYL